MKSQRTSRKAISRQRVSSPQRSRSSSQSTQSRSLSAISTVSSSQRGYSGFAPSSGSFSRRRSQASTSSRNGNSSAMVSRRQLSPSNTYTTPSRSLHLHEYQSKAIMDQYNVRIQKCDVAETPEQAQAIAERFQTEGAQKLVVKAQIHAGGRGKGFFKETNFKGGVQIAQTPAQIHDFSKEMFGKHLVTKQTGPDGQLVSKVLVEEGIDILSEKYVAFLMDRSYKGPVIMASPYGGMNIEEVAEKDPKAVKMIPVNITEGITDAQATEAATFIGFTGETIQDAATQIRQLYEVFIRLDATQVEINPLALASDNKVYAVDAKLNLDDNAFFRQKEIFAQRDTTMEDARDVAAAKYDLNYVGLDGNIGCMVNGAGLAMATMDIIKLNGGWPANFLDVGGGATAKQVEEAFKILTADPKVEAILVNIFGGIMKCDIIAEGIITAARNLELKVPLVVRLEGTNVQKGVEMLNNSGLAIISASDLDDAAQKACKAVGITPTATAKH